MTEGEAERLMLRGRLAELDEDVQRTAREVGNLFRPLRDRFFEIKRTVDTSPDLPGRLDLVAARQELESLAAADARLDGLLAERNDIASRLGKPPLRR